jgi:O-antigen/teichoic acid export membrane protein
MNVSLFPLKPFIRSLKLNRYLDINFDDKKILFKNSFWMFLAEFINKLVMFSLTILVARYLGVEGYGQLAFAMSFTGLFIILADFGTSTLAIKEIARDKDSMRKYLDNFVVLKFFLSLFTILVIYLVLPFLEKPVSVELMVYLFGVFILITSTGEFISSIFKAYEKMEYIAISVVIRSITMLILILFFVFLDLGVFYIILAYLLGALFSLFFLIFSLRKKISKFSLEFDPNFNFNLLKRASPFALSLAFASIYLSIDSVLISHLIGDKALGYYSLGYSLTIVFYIIPALLSNVYLPKLSVYFKSDKLKLKSVFRLLLIKLCLIVIPLILFLYFIAPHIFLLFYGSEFTNSIIVFQVLLIALLFKFFSFPYSFLLIATEKQNIRVAIQGFSALFNIVTNIIFIPKYGILGAAGTTIASELLLVILYYSFARKVLD